jgi:predicted porin
MNKKLIAAAIGAALAAPAAYADATVYGQLKVHVDSTGSSSGGESMSASGSRLGFKGSEDLGNGLKAVYKLEFGLDMDDPGHSTTTFGVLGATTSTAGVPTDATVITTTTGGTVIYAYTTDVVTGGDAAGITSRSQYVGLAGGFGTFMFGKRETNFLLSTSKLDLFADTMADYNSVIGFDEKGTIGNGGTGGARPNNAIHYVSPSFSGLTVSGALYGDDSELNGTGWDIAAVYKNGGIHASAAYASDEADSSSAIRLGLGYKMDAFTVGVVYEDQDTSSDNTLWMINGSYTMGNNTIKAMYGDNDNGGDGWALGVDHKFSKRTKVYALYADSDNSLNSEAKGDLSGFSLGMQHNF